MSQLWQVYKIRNVGMEQLLQLMHLNQASTSWSNHTQIYCHWQPLSCDWWNSCKNEHHSFTHQQCLEVSWSVCNVGFKTVNIQTEGATIKLSLWVLHIQIPKGISCNQHLHQNRISMCYGSMTMPHPKLYHILATTELLTRSCPK